VKIKYFLFLFLFNSQLAFSQEDFVTDEEFKSRISWLLPSEEISSS